jgi:hypothetical protein
MADPQLAPMLTHLSGSTGRTQAKLKAAISKTWENVMKPYEEGGASTSEELADIRERFIWMFADEGLGNTAGVIFDAAS